MVRVRAFVFLLLDATMAFMRVPMVVATMRVSMMRMTKGSETDNVDC